MKKMKDLKNIILEQIQDKKQIQDLDSDYIEDKITKYFLRNGDKYKKLKTEFEKNKDKIVKNKVFKEIIKEIKKEIGIVYGSFLTQNFKKKEKILEKIEIEELNEDMSKINEMLKLHKSSRERFDFYETIYSKIFSWRKPKMIADLACGLNPLSYFFIKDALKREEGLKEEEVEYFASDLNPNDMDFLNLFFKQFSVKGEAKAYDLTNLTILNDENLKKSDMVFLFKALDSLEFVKKNVSKELLLGLTSRYLVVSFPTKSLASKQNFKIEKRNWFINFIEKQGWKYETFEIENELFFLIEKLKT